MRRTLTFSLSSGGESGIRTHGGRKPTAVFKTAALNHSAISPLSLSYRSGSLTIDLRSMFAPAFSLRSQDCCLEPLGHASVFFQLRQKKTCHPEPRLHRVRDLLSATPESATADPSPLARDDNPRGAMRIEAPASLELPSLLQLRRLDHPHAGTAILTCFSGAIPPGQWRQLRREASNCGGRVSAR
jgi:hypothetical protein